MNAPRRFDPNQQVTVNFTMTRSIAQLQQLIQVLDAGPHYLVREIIDTITQAALALPEEPASAQAALGIPPLDPPPEQQNVATPRRRNADAR